jgi:hypothetical protein
MAFDPPPRAGHCAHPLFNARAHASTEGGTGADGTRYAVSGHCSDFTATIRLGQSGACDRKTSRCREMSLQPKRSYVDLEFELNGQGLGFCFTCKVRSGEGLWKGTRSPLKACTQ